MPDQAERVRGRRKSHLSLSNSSHLLSFLVPLELPYAHGVNLFQYRRKTGSQSFFTLAPSRSHALFALLALCHTRSALGPHQLRTICSPNSPESALPRASSHPFYN
ncbi:Hypothetical protein NTJ_00544 [Nesidiocoris tenuis]|uniref:Uncharacterized protein n=1 Tax=Nesidiocoris tenuis TaxID=355587 RepID=A0ABN7A8Z4_9HEMI|nr:Hypothetical protein NTJ_00544 [Nesidiocoris tenuis]